MYISFGTLTVVLISSTPGAGGSLTRKSTGIANAEETPIVVPGRKEAPPPPAGEEGAGASEGRGGARVVAPVVVGMGKERLGPARTREGRRWMVDCLDWLSLTMERGIAG